MRIRMKAGVSLVLWLLFVSQAAAESWILVETRALPKTCANPIDCVPKASLISRDLMNLTPRNRDTLLNFLRSTAAVKDVPEPAKDALPHVNALQALPIAPKLAPLVKHPGVYFDSTTFDKDPITKGMSDYIRTSLEDAGLKMLTKKEWESTPGRPKLSMRFTARLESAGCIVPFAIYMTIKEEVVLTRAPKLKIEATVWSSSRRQNLANTHYAPRNALQELIEVFVADWRKANPRG